MKDSPVPDMYDKIEGESTLLGKIASKIPGFSGYIEKGRRREADQILRETIAGRLEEIRVELGAIHEILSRDIIKAIDHAEPMGQADTRLMGLIGKVRDAPQGYAGFFDAVKVKEDDLARVYAFDESMLAFADQIGADVHALQKAVDMDENISSTIRLLTTNLSEANSTWNSRGEILSGVA
jgi:hypothetical protein